MSKRAEYVSAAHQAGRIYINDVVLASPQESLRELSRIARNADRWVTRAYMPITGRRWDLFIEPFREKLISIVRESALKRVEEIRATRASKRRRNRGKTR